MDNVEQARQALAGKDVAERAAAARHLAAHGSWDDLSSLLTIAMGDKSPSVRLYTAAAATRVVLRSRGAGEVGRAEEQQVLEAFRRFDPQGNPSLMMVLGALGSATARSRLGRLLRDPHSDVRMAAAAAVRRAALSQVAHSDEGLTADVAEWLASKKTPLDTRTDLVRLVGETGWAELAPEVRKAAALGGYAAEVAAEALSRLGERAEASAWTGLWLHGGGDVLDEDAATPSGWLLVAEGEVHDGERSRPSTLADGRLDLGSLGRARRLWAPRVKEEGAHQALQLPSATYWRCTGKALAKEVEARIHELGRFPAGCAVLAAELEEVEGAIAPRARALARWKAGDNDGAVSAVDALLAAKKPKAELYWWRANMALGEGALDDARSFVDAYLEKAPKRGGYRAEAEALRASLSR